MAKGIVCIKPNADILLGHPVYPSTLSAGYLAINDLTSDGESTYIGENPSPNGGSYSSIFKMSVFENVKIKNIISAKFIFDGDVYDATSNLGGASTPSVCECNVKVSGISVFSGRKYHDADATPASTDTLSNKEMPDFVTTVNDYINTNGVGNMPEITIDITNSSSSVGANNKTQSYSYVTMVEIRLECEYIPNIYIKNDNGWVCPAPRPIFYKKIKGLWNKISEDECKNYIKSNNFIIDKCSYHGHNEVAAPDIEPTCTETGWTNVKRCTFCGKISTNYGIVIPALGHDEVAAPGTETCTEDGMIGGTMCSRCGITLKEHDKVQPARHDEVAASGTATCTEDGMIGGTKCSRCGITIKEHDTVQPALGHDYTAYTGKCSRCSEYSPNSFTFTIQKNTSTSASTYHAMPNVTWGEWARSQPYLMFDGWIVNSDGTIRYYYNFLGTEDFTVDGVTENDLIIPGHAYTATDAT